MGLTKFNVAAKRGVADPVLALGYLYEYPLYVLLGVYSRYQGWTGLASPPALTHLDYAFLLSCVAILAFVWLRPRHYLRSEDGGLSYGVYRKGRRVDIISRTDLATLVIRRHDRRRSPSRDSGFISSIRIYSHHRPGIVFRDAVPGPFYWYEKRLARKLARRLGGDIKWKDRDGILDGRVDRNREVRIKQRQERIAGAAARSRRDPPRVKKAYGVRLFLIVVFSGFGAAFWQAGHAIAGMVFGGLGAAMLIDLLLALKGFGQQPNKP